MTLPRSAESPPPAPASRRGACRQPGRPSAPRRVTAIVLVLSLAVFMASLDLFIVNLAFPYIGHDFSGTSLSSLSWVLNGYTIVLAAVLVPAGRWADRVGRRRLFVGGLIAFSIGSLLCGLAPDVLALIGARVIQAIGAGLMVPASLSLLLAAVPGRPGRGPSAPGRRWAPWARRSGRSSAAGWSSSAGGGCSGSTCRWAWPACCWPPGSSRRARTSTCAGGPTWPAPGCSPRRSGCWPSRWSRRRTGAGGRSASTACCWPRWPAGRPWCSAPSGITPP